MIAAAWRPLAGRIYWLVLGLLTAASTLCVSFVQFMAYDDEGYLLMFARKLVGGGRLYDDVFGQYGPAYALWKVLLHGALGVPLSHTGVRLETTALVMASLALLVLGVHRLTRSVWAAALALLACQGHLFLMADHEPGHPQFLCLLLFSSALWLAAAASRRPSDRWPAVAAGAAAALLALTKVNAGLFLALALAAWRALAWARGRALRAAVLCGLALAVELALFAGDPALWRQWGWKYFLVSSLSLTGTMIAAWAGTEGGDRSPPWRWVLAGAAGGALAVAAWTLARGTTPRALLDGALLQPLRLGTRFSVPAPLGAESVALAIAGAGTAAAWGLRARRRGGDAAAGSALIGVARLGFGAFVAWRALTAYSAYVALEGAAGLWLLAAAGARSKGANGDPGLRSLVALAVAWQLPYAFPVAGTQTGYVAALVAACGVICLRDGLRWLASREWRLPRAVPRTQAMVAGVALAGVLAAQSAAAAARWQQYRGLKPLRLRGADWVRLGPDQADTLRRVTAAITAAGCERLLSFPGMFSFNAWAAVDSPTGVNVTAWMILPERDQLRLLRDVEAFGAVCILRNRALEAGWARRDLTADPVARWLAARPLEPLARVGDYELSVVRGRLDPAWSGGPTSW